MKLYALTDGINIYAVKAMTEIEAIKAQRYFLLEAPPPYYKNWKLLSECEYFGTIKEMA